MDTINKYYIAQIPLKKSLRSGY